MPAEEVPLVVIQEPWRELHSKWQLKQLDGNKSLFITHYGPDNENIPWTSQQEWTGRKEARHRVTSSRLRNHAREGKRQLRAVDFFYEFFTEEWMQKICDATNAHVARKVDPQLSPHPAKLHDRYAWPPVWTTKWKPLDVPEFKSWLVLLIFLGINRPDSKSEEEMWSEG